jgi:hypothetical protein
MTTMDVDPSPVYSAEPFPTDFDAVFDDLDLFEFDSLMLQHDDPFLFILDEMESQRVAHRTRQVPIQCLPVMSPLVLKKTDKRRRLSEPCHSLGPSSWLENQVNIYRGKSQEKTPANTSVCPNESRLQNCLPRRASCGKANPMTRHKHWTIEEDEILRVALADLGNETVNWNKIARTHFQGVRSSAQCKSRWKNVSVCGRFQDSEIVGSLIRPYK